MIEFRGITKHFGGVTALRDVSLAIAGGECHGLMGENGAGKSTLARVLAGIHTPDAGAVLIDGRPLSLRSPADAAAAGIGMVHQELAFCPELSVAENLCMGRYPRRLGVMLDRPAMRRRASELLGRIHVTMDVDRLMRTLSTGQEQLVQIASALGTGARVLVFDEPTSSLSQNEAQELFALIEDLRRRGVAMIYVSHRLPEVLRLCDRISVLRDGQYVGTLDRAQASEDSLIRMMVGRELGIYRRGHLARASAQQPVLRVQGLTSPGRFQDVSFSIRPGEIVGFAGLVGAGRSEVARAVFGLDRAKGVVEVGGLPLPGGSVRAAMSAGIALVPEDRKRQGLVLAMSGKANTSMAVLDRLRRMGLLDRAAERSTAERLYAQLRVRAPSIETPVAQLSGGNQQKVALAKWLARGGRVLIADEPTRGVDVGAKAAIHAILDDLAAKGVGIMLISSELPELLNLSSRILVMRQGRIVGELDSAAAGEEAVMRLMAGMGEG
jgi:ABC-type sugar transport system ATPase subunit